jgi:probable HAF family extracellular repeat protein
MEIPSVFAPSGQVLGGSQKADRSWHAFSWTSAGGLVDLGTLGGSYSCARGVNALGQIVGYAATVGDAAQHAFIHDATGMKDLNDLVPNKPAGMELQEAYFLMDSGAMIAATNVGPILLTPTSPGPAAPVVGAITATDPVAVGATLSISASFTDANTTDSHTASLTWGDGGAPQAGTVNESNGSGTTKGSHTFAAAGIYPVSVKVTDNGGLAGNGSRNVVVYDPSAGFVTGSGSISSPLGAFKADPSVVGTATFSFVSKYQKGAQVPVGTTAFQFQSANLDFYSDSYNWMVVTGQARAQFKGTGSLNDADDYKFMLTAIDGQATGSGGKDRFRIKIWHYDAALQQDIVDYDNQIDASTEGTLSEGTEIASGNIVIHTANK